MTTIIDNEDELIKYLKEKHDYEDFPNRYLKPKIDGENTTWELLKKNRGHYKQDILNQVFDTVDLHSGKKVVWTLIV